MIAVAHRAGAQRRRIRSGAGLGQAIARQISSMVQSFGSHLLALGVVAEGIDHPGRHVVDRDEGRHRRAALRQRLEDQRGVETRQRRAADIVADIDAADAELGGLAHHVDREMLLLVPADRMRRDFLRGEIPRHVANRNLVLVECELHALFALTVVNRSRRHCEERSDEAIHDVAADGCLDCFAALAMTDASQFIVGIAKSAPSLMPDGQRAVTVLVLV